MPPGVALELVADAHRLGRQLGVNRYLCDFRGCRNIGSVYQNYAFAYDDTEASPDIDPFARVAILIAPEDGSHEFSVTVARNSGKNLTSFTRLEAAQKFLTEE